MQGSDDGSNFVATGLTNQAGTEQAVTGDKVFDTVERPLFVRPNLTTAGTNAAVTVVAMVRRRNVMRT